MAYAINIRSDNKTALSLESLWDKCCELELVPTMRALEYPPHITLAVYDEVPLHNLRAGFESALEKLEKVTIRFESLGFFQAPHAIILWAAPLLPLPVSEAYSAIHSLIDVSLCRPNYRPDLWVPHSSLATSVPLERKSDAVALLDELFEPIEVVFDVLDYASFPPVQVLQEVSLETIQSDR